MNQPGNRGTARRFKIAALVCLLAVLISKPARVWNAVIEAPHWMLFSIAYLMEWDTNDSWLIQTNHKIMDFFVENAIIPKAKPVTIIDFATANMSVAEILEKHSDGYSHPVVIKGLFKDVPAVEKWKDPDFFTRCCGDDEYLALVDGRILSMNHTGSKLSDVYVQKTMPLAQLVENIKQGKKNYINNLSDIFRKHNDVLDDLQLPTTIGPWWGREKNLYRPVMAQLFMGMGSKDRKETTGSSWHCARHGNLFIQVVGTKEWTFMDPEYSILAAPHLRHHVVAAAGDRRGWIHQHRWPTKIAVIEPGDLLFNPPWQWHSVMNGEGFTIGVATREIMNIRTIQNNFLFTALQEFTEAKTSFFDYKRPVQRFLSKIPFFFLTIASIKEAITGYTPAPTDAWTNSCDEHSPVCIRAVTDLQKGAAVRGK